MAVESPMTAMGATDVGDQPTAAAVEIEVDDPSTRRALYRAFDSYSSHVDGLVSMVSCRPRW